VPVGAAHASLQKFQDEFAALLARSIERQQQWLVGSGIQAGPAKTRWRSSPPPLMRAADVPTAARRCSQRVKAWLPNPALRGTAPIGQSRVPIHIDAPLDGAQGTDT
jgi:hypothetical protein